MMINVLSLSVSLNLSLWCVSTTMKIKMLCASSVAEHIKPPLGTSASMSEAFQCPLHGHIKCEDHPAGALSTPLIVWAVY